jgi:predicted nucleic acid-binding protein
VRVLVDTSVWVDFFNGHPSPEADALAGLLDEEVELLTCGVIVAEFLQGIRDHKSLATLERHFCEMDWLTPREPDTYLSAAALFRELRARGIRIRSTIDCLIAQLAAENNALLLSKDRDFTLIVRSGIAGVKSLPLP